MLIMEFFSQPIWERLGLTLMHFIWQGLAVAVLMGMFMWLFRFRSDNIRYALYLSAFLFMLICPIATFWIIDIPVESNPILLNEQEYSQLDYLSSINNPGFILDGAGAYPYSDTETVHSGVSITTIGIKTVPLRERMASYFNSFLPWAIAVWLAGVFTLSLRLLLGFVGICRWRRKLEAPSANLQERIKCLCQKLGMSKLSRVYISPKVLQAMAVGYFRPMVLLPAAIITRMPPEMLEAVIAHELAHIRRFDLWVNLLQRIAETLLFYHPAVWWLSGRLRHERELCCDELAARAIGEKVTYARTLEYISHLQLGSAPQVLAAGMAQSNKSILNRVRHILGQAAPPRNNRFWAAGIITALILIALFTPAVFMLRAQAEDVQSNSPKDEIAPAGLISRLPSDGTWARFEMEQVFENESFNKEGTVTIASVGKVRVNDRPCRWLEITLEEHPVGQDWFKMWAKWKVLIPENLVGKNQNLLEHAEALWKSTFQDKKPSNINGMKEGNEYQSLVHILAGPDQQVERLAQKKISTGLGDFTCKGWSGHRIIKMSFMVDDTVVLEPTKISYRQWPQAKSPFGVIFAEIEEKNYFTSASKVTRFTLSETGQGARPEISLEGIPLEKQVARPYAPDPGWWWIINPKYQFTWGTFASSGVTIRAERGDDGLDLYLAHPNAKEEYIYRPVAFDAEMNRYDFEFKNGLGSYSVALDKFTLDNDVIAHDQIVYLGVEKKLEPVTSAPISLINKPLPDFEPLNLKLPNADVENKPLLLYFFDMNQRPSRNCITELAKKYEALKPKGITIAAVQTSDVDRKS
ncbi:M56 family metallopeptidase, partial [Planctomycetota bacterium]